MVRKENGLNSAEKALTKAEAEVADLTKSLDLSEAEKKKLQAELRVCIMSNIRHFNLISTAWNGSI